MSRDLEPSNYFEHSNKQATASYMHIGHKMTSEHTLYRKRCFTLTLSSLSTATVETKIDVFFSKEKK